MSKGPSHTIVFFREYTKSDGTKGSEPLKIGSGFTNKDGSINCDTVHGKFTVFPAKGEQAEPSDDIPY